MRFGILGAGNWGSIFGIMLNELGHQVTLWEFNYRRAEVISQTRDNSPFLVGRKIPEAITITSELTTVLDGIDFLIIALPSQSVPDIIKSLPGGVPTLSLVKGMDVKRQLRISEILGEKIKPDLIAVLSGPSIANEVKDRNPTSVVIASTNNNLASQLQSILSSNYFRVYRSDDLIGAEFCGVYKNTIAIACGICDGLGFGTNAKAALISRGLVEMKRFVVAAGGKAQTVFGLAGLGDIITTSFSRHSRNRRLGEKIGQGMEVKEALREIVMVAEGYYSTPVLIKLGGKLGVELPIAQAVDSVLANLKKPTQVVEELMLRPLRSEGVQ
ncbi:MAG TPA: NAD(P)-dependent glycerol-3-phosphate dehydrogenase [bacterium (Candidatus Stahlbacteria)]|nr:NAD(P)-dependent glycerol-3-phosphate dehydrogenase [Candidatus Stahlbacteria bacterium]